MDTDAILLKDFKTVKIASYTFSLDELVVGKNCKIAIDYTKAIFESPIKELLDSKNIKDDLTFTITVQLFYGFNYNMENFAVNSSGDFYIQNFVREDNNISYIDLIVKRKYDEKTLIVDIKFSEIEDDQRTDYLC